MPSTSWRVRVMTTRAESPVMRGSLLQGLESAYLVVTLNDTRIDVVRARSRR